MQGADLHPLSRDRPESEEAKRRNMGVRSKLRKGEPLEAHIAVHISATPWQEEARLHSGCPLSEGFWRADGAMFVRSRLEYPVYTNIGQNCVYRHSSLTSFEIRAIVSEI